MNKKLWVNIVCAVMAMCALGLTALAQEKGLSCDDNWSNGDRAGHCVMKEQTLASTGSLAVDGKKNGGVSVKGWDRGEVLVRSKIQSWGNTKADAVTVANQVLVVTANSSIYAEGPTTNGELSWAVSYEIFVPRNSNLSLKAHNGGVSISNVRGQIEFSTTNGGVNLKNLAGNVKGMTKNGGVNVDLDGNRWDGAGLDVTTTNGGVNVRVPENYSARLETGTVNGGMKTEIPMVVQGEINRNLSVDLGSGGAPIKVRTTNGGVSVKRQSLK